ncbi:MAG: DUF3263 domain-containing protein [Actinomycetota bacterium]
MLDHLSRAVLDLERGWWLLPGPKDELVFEQLGITAAAYYSRLEGLLDDPAAFGYDPMTVLRLRRVRATAGEPWGAAGVGGD